MSWVARVESDGYVHRIKDCVTVISQSCAADSCYPDISNLKFELHSALAGRMARLISATAVFLVVLSPVNAFVAHPPIVRLRSSVAHPPSSTKLTMSSHPSQGAQDAQVRSLGPCSGRDPFSHGHAPSYRYCHELTLRWHLRLLLQHPLISGTVLAPFIGYCTHVISDTRASCSLTFLDLTVVPVDRTVLLRVFQLSQANHSDFRYLSMFMNMTRITVCTARTARPACIGGYLDL